MILKNDVVVFFFFQAEDGIRDWSVTGVQTVLFRSNDYNLNIPRYVDTFEEEEPIDLDLVQQQLTDIDKEITDVESEINDYLKELGVLKND